MGLRVQGLGFIGFRVYEVMGVGVRVCRVSGFGVGFRGAQLPPQPLKLGNTCSFCCCLVSE